MEHQLWKRILAALEPFCEGHYDPHETFSCRAILAVWFWAVLHDRPVSWAVERRNWPIHLRRPLPSNATMSRRLRSAPLRDILNRCERKLLGADRTRGLVWLVDGKPLLVGGNSRDPRAGYGRAAGGMGKGYKLHPVLGIRGEIARWRIAPMNEDERVMAARMLKSAALNGYLLGDGNYDATGLHDACAARGSLQMVSPRRKTSAGKPPGKRQSSPGRLRSIAFTEDPNPFRRDVRRLRLGIERYFGKLANAGGMLTHLPMWVRTYPRVRRWVQAKMMARAAADMPLAA